MKKHAKMGEAAAFLLSVVSCAHDNCIPWPFANHSTGYGVIGWKGKTARTHRVMCELKHGPPPFPKADAAHSCNNRPCINPNHLRWDTRAGNLADMIAAGTAPRGERHGNAVLTERNAIRIATSADHPEDLARQIGVDRETVTAVRLGRSWSWLTGIKRAEAKPRLGEHSPNHRYTAEQALEIYSDRRAQKTIAADYGCDPSLISRIKNGHLWASVTGHANPVTAGG